MNNSRKIINPVNGNEVPVTINLNVKPLYYAGKKVINGSGNNVLDDQWIYVNMAHYGLKSINVNRSQFCQKIYLSNISIKDSINSNKITAKLEKFIKEVSDKLVFEKNGITYRVFIKKTGNIYDLDSVKCYWLITNSPNLHIDLIPDRYKTVCVSSKELHLQNWAHTLHVDLQKAFNFYYD